MRLDEIIDDLSCDSLTDTHSMLKTDLLETIKSKRLYLLVL